MKLRIDAKYIPLLATALVLIALYVGGCVKFSDRGFDTLRNARNLLSEKAYLGIAAVGATFVILSGGIDLSVGSVAAATSILVAVLIETYSVPPGAAIVIALASGAAFGTVMGCLIHFFELPPFLVTLGGLFFARGAGFFVCPSLPALPSLTIRHPFYQQTIPRVLAIQLTREISLPFVVICLAAVFLVAIYVLHSTRFGRNVYAIGGDERSAALMGLPVARTRVLVYTVAGFCSAAAGVAFSFGVYKGDPAACIGLELEAIAATVIGGTLLSGGVGFLAGTLMGVLILRLIQSLITMQGLSASWTKIVVGTLLLVFILLQNLVAALSRQGQKIPPASAR